MVCEQRDQAVAVDKFSMFVNSEASISVSIKCKPRVVAAAGNMLCKLSDICLLYTSPSPRDTR